MHGFAQRALPLLVEVGPASPFGNERKGKAARVSSEHFWQLYLALPEGQKKLLQIKALVGHATSKTVFLAAVHKAGLRSPDGKAYVWASLNEQLHALQRQGLLDSTLDCIPEIIHAVAADAGQSEGGTGLIAAVKAAIPKSEREAGRASHYYYHHIPPLSQDVDLFRHLRLSVYANDEAEFGRLLRLAEPEAEEFQRCTELTRFFAIFPVSLAWLEHLRPAIREIFAEHVIQMFIEQGQQTEEAGAVLQHYANAAPGEAGENIVELLPRFDILSANFDRARQHIAALPESEAHLGAAYEASIAFLTGDNAAAITGFRAALKLLRKSLGRRKVAFEAEAGLFHMLALLRANDPALHTELRGLIDAATMEVTPYYLAHRGVEALLDLIEGRHEKAQQAAAQLVEQPSRCPAAGTIVALAALFIDSALMRERVVDNEAEYNRLAKTMPVLARIYAGILSRTARDGTSWRERAAGLGGKDLIEITEIIAFKQPWERAFDTLTAFLKPGEPKRPAEKTTAKTKRLAWLVDVSSSEVSVVEQSMKGGGWTGGRPVALKRLHMRDARLDYLNEHDQRMCRCVRKELDWYNDGYYYFDEYATLPALAGHPNIYNAASREHIELIAYPAELVVKETAGGYNFNLSHHDSEPKVFLEMETPSRWRVVELSRKLLELQATLGEHGLTVPRDMRDRVAALLERSQSHRADPLGAGGHRCSRDARRRHPGDAVAAA